MSSSRRLVAVVAVALAVITLVGWTLIEVIPRYGVERHRHQGAGRLDHPTFLIGDCAYYRATLVSLLEDRDLDIQNNLAAQRYPMAGNVSRGRNGAYYPKHPSLLAWSRCRSVRSGRYRPAGVQPAAARWCWSWIGARRYASDRSRSLMLWFAFGTMLRPAAYYNRADVLSGLPSWAASWRYSLSLRAAGVQLGLSVWAKWTSAVFPPVGSGDARIPARLARAGPPGRRGGGPWPAAGLAGACSALFITPTTGCWWSRTCAG